MSKLKRGIDKSVAKTLKAGMVSSDDDHSDHDDGDAPRPSRSSSQRNGPTIAPAAPAMDALPKDRDGDGDVDSEDDLDFDENGFLHPSIYTNQPWIWLPKDEIGVSDRLVKEFQAVGVDASDLGAFMDTKGNVEVQRNPPDEDWAGGHDA